MNKLLSALLFISSALLIACNSSTDTELKNKSANTTNNFFFPGLLQQLDEVNNLVVSKAGAKVLVSLSRNDGGWQLEKPDAVPANPYLVEEILSEVATAKVLEIKTTETNWYQHLGVRGVHLPASKGMMIEIKSPKQSWRVIVGKQSDAQKGQYWRQPEQVAVMRVDQVLSLPEDLLSWMDRLIIDVPANGVAEIEITSSAGSDFLLKRKDTQQDLSIDSRQIDPALSQKLLRGLYKLHYDQIRTSSSTLEKEPEYKLQYTLFDRSELILTCLPDTEGSWCQLRVKAAVSEKAPGDSAKLEKAMNQRFSKWDFHLSAGRTELFTQAIKSLEEIQNQL